MQSYGSYGVETRTFEIMYQTILITIAAYAAEVWRHKLAYTHVKRALRSAQCKALKSGIGAYKIISNLAVMMICGQPPLDLIVEDWRFLITSKEKMVSQRMK